MKRVGEMQTCPALRNFEATITFSTCSTSTSSNTSTAACPPSSMVVRLQSSAASFMRCLPTTVEPVKLSLRMIGEDSRWRDTSSGTPNTACPTSLGSPASSRHCRTASAEAGASSAALRITEQPAAMGAPSLRPGLPMGKFQGAKAATGPTGSQTTVERMPLGRTSWRP